MINWRVRFKNANFWIQIALAVIVPVLAYFGLTAQDFTTWPKLFKIISDALMNPYVLFTVLVSVYNAVNDPTTKGITDSDRAMTYKEPK